MVLMGAGGGTKFGGHTLLAQTTTPRPWAQPQEFCYLMQRATLCISCIVLQANQMILAPKS